MAKSNFSFEWNYSHSIIIKRKGFGKELNKYFADIFAQYSDEFVPFDTGALANSVRTQATEDHGTVTYMAPYAPEQYSGYNGNEVLDVPFTAAPPWNRNREIHPLATSLWDKACWNTYGSVISRKLNEKRKELSV